MNMYNYSYSGRYMSSASGIYQAGTKDCAEKRITMNNQEMMELTTVDKSEFEELVKECTRSGSIDQNLYIEYDVKRGLRDSNGNGVLTGLTEISDVCSTKMIDGKLHEPMEFLIIEVPDTYVGPVMEKLGSRKGELINMGTREGGVTHIEFRIPSRGLMGYRPEFLTDTNGNGIMNHVFDGYEPYKGEIVTRHQGSLIAFETGETVTYGLYAAQERGRLFIGPGVPVYEGMIVGASPKSEDITVNVCKKKHITNTRASGSDDALKLTPPTIMSLEQCLEFIADDELVEVTPENIRMRKRILSKEQRMKQAFRKK